MRHSLIRLVYYLNRVLDHGVRWCVWIGNSSTSARAIPNQLWRVSSTDVVSVAQSNRLPWGASPIYDNLRRMELGYCYYLLHKMWITLEEVVGINCLIATECYWELAILLPNSIDPRRPCQQVSTCQPHHTLLLQNPRHPQMSGMPICSPNRWRLSLRPPPTGRLYAFRMESRLAPTIY